MNIFKEEKSAAGKDTLKLESKAELSKVESLFLLFKYFLWTCVRNVTTMELSFISLLSIGDTEWGKRQQGTRNKSRKLNSS